MIPERFLSREFATFNPEEIKNSIRIRQSVLLKSNKSSSHNFSLNFIWLFHFTLDSRFWQWYFTRSDWNLLRALKVSHESTKIGFLMQVLWYWGIYVVLVFNVCMLLLVFLTLRYEDYLFFFEWLKNSLIWNTIFFILLLLASYSPWELFFACWQCLISCIVWQS